MAHGTTTAEFSEVQLGAFGRGYALGRMEGQLGLAHTTLELWRSHGQVAAVVPLGTSPERAGWIDSGLDVRGGYGDWLHGRLQALREGGCSGDLVVHEYGRDAGDDLGAAPDGIHTLRVGSDVYHVLPLDMASEEAVTGLLSWLPFFENFLGVVTQRQAGTELCSRLEADDKAAVLDDVAEMYLNAYDGDGWIVWRRDDASRAREPISRRGR